MHIYFLFFIWDTDVGGHPVGEGESESITVSLSVYVYVKGSVSHHTHSHTYRCHSSFLCRQWGCRLFTPSFRQAKANVGDQLYVALRNIANRSPQLPLASLYPSLGPSGPPAPHTHYTGGPMFKAHHSVDNLTEENNKNSAGSKHMLLVHSWWRMHWY